jgi:hypothetical protein
MIAGQEVNGAEDTVPGPAAWAAVQAEEPSALAYRYSEPSNALVAISLPPAVGPTTIA